MVQTPYRRQVVMVLTLREVFIKISLMIITIELKFER